MTHDTSCLVAFSALIAACDLVAHATTLDASAEGKVWARLMPAGVFSGRDGRGPFTAGDRKALENIVAKTRAYMGGTDVVVDYDHQSMTLHGMATGANGSAKAAGWIKQIEARDDGIYGQIEWTDKAAAYIKGREYRYLSPVFKAPNGRVERLHNVALTNVPNLNLEEVTAHTFNTPNNGTAMEKLLKLLGLAEDASEADILAAVTKLQEGNSEVAKAAGLEANASTADVVAFIANAKETKPAKPDPTEYVPMTAFTDLQSQFRSLQTARDTEKAEAAVLEAMTAGVLTPALKDWGLELFKADEKAFQAFVAAAPKLTTSQMPQGKRPEGDPVLSDGDLAAMSAMGVSKEDFLEARKLEIV